MARQLSPEQRRRARALIAKHKGVRPENIPDSSIELALDAGTILMSELGSSSSSSSGYNSYSSSLDTGSSSSYGGSSDSGGSSGGGGGGCD